MKKIKIKSRGIYQSVFYCLGLHFRGPTTSYEKIYRKGDQSLKVQTIKNIKISIIANNFTWHIHYRP
jgi:hypothetical protein